MISAQYITEIKAKLLASPVISSMAVVKERTGRISYLQIYTK